MTKQVIVMRTDLNMRKGKMCAQAAHASLKVFLDRMILLEVGREKKPNEYPDPAAPIENLFFSTYKTQFTDAMLEWANWQEGQPGFTKIVVGCDNEAELLSIEKKCEELGIPNAIMRDNGLTEFHGVQTATCIAIGPAEATLIDTITGGYKLL